MSGERVVATYTAALDSYAGVKVTVTIEDSEALVDDIIATTEATVRGVLASIGEADYFVSIQPVRPTVERAS